MRFGAAFILGLPSLAAAITLEARAGGRIDPGQLVDTDSGARAQQRLREAEQRLRDKQLELSREFRSYMPEPVLKKFTTDVEHLRKDVSAARSRAAALPMSGVPALDAKAGGRIDPSQLVDTNSRARAQQRLREAEQRLRDKQLELSRGFRSYMPEPALKKFTTDVEHLRKDVSEARASLALLDTGKQ